MRPLPRYYTQIADLNIACLFSGSSTYPPSPGVIACQPNHGWEVNRMIEYMKQRHLGSRASLQPWRRGYFLHRFAEVAHCPEGCVARPSNLGLGGLSLSCRSQRLEVWGGERAPRSVWSNQAARTRKTSHAPMLHAGSRPACSFGNATYPAHNGYAPAGVTADVTAVSWRLRDKPCPTGLRRGAYTPRAP
jgi:hypothetical protein